MKGKLIFGFILLATLSMVNAETKFGKCPVTDPPIPVLLEVKLNPDPIVKGKTFDVTFSGALEVDVPNDEDTQAQLPFLREEVPIGDYTSVGFCTLEGIKCPMKAGTKFETTIKNVTVPDNVANGDRLAVAVINVEEFDGCAYSDPLSF